MADRWHLWHNLAEHVEKTIAAHHGCLRQPDTIAPEVGIEPGSAADLAEAAEAAQVQRREHSAVVARTKARHQTVHALKADGKGIKTIMRELDLAKETVRRFYRAKNVEELLATPRAGRPSVLDAYKPYLHERWSAGITNASTLHREITEQGYHGSRATVAAYLAPFRALGAAPPATPAHCLTDEQGPTRSRKVSQIQIQIQISRAVDTAGVPVAAARVGGRPPPGTLPAVDAPARTSRVTTC